MPPLKLEFWRQAVQGRTVRLGEFQQIRSGAGLLASASARVLRNYSEFSHSATSRVLANNPRRPGSGKVRTGKSSRWTARPKVRPFGKPRFRWRSLPPMSSPCRSSSSRLSSVETAASGFWIGMTQLLATVGPHHAQLQPVLGDSLVPLQKIHKYASWQDSNRRGAGRPQ